MISLTQKTEIIDFITSNFGTYVNIEQWFDLEAKIKNACLELHVSNWESFAISIPTLSPKSKELETFACQLSVGETYFFRETRALDLFQNEIIPSLLKTHSINKTITIWSAGCCSGEEPYTLAMILKESIPNIEEWNINILATDINPKFLYKASQGLYTPWSFRNTPDWAMKKYFKKLDKQFEIDASIRKMVKFNRVNLVDETAFPSNSIKPWSVDVIFCRNVFIYFPTDQIRNISQRFKRCLNESGLLITSPVEVSNDGLKNLRYEWHPGVGVLRKDSNYKEENLESLDINSVKSSENMLIPSAMNKTYTPPPRPKTQSFQDIQKDTIGKLLLKAQDMFNDGQYCLASTYVKDILKHNRNNPDALVIQAKIFANLGDHNGAIVILKNLTNRNKNDAYLHYLLATMHSEAQEQDLAEKSLRQALYLRPDMISAQFLMGNIMQSQGNRKSAQKHFKNLLILLNKHPKEDVLPELDGMTAGALSEIINCLVA